MNFQVECATSHISDIFAVFSLLPHQILAHKGLLDRTRNGRHFGMSFDSIIFISLAKNMKTTKEKRKRSEILKQKDRECAKLRRQVKKEEMGQFSELESKHRLLTSQYNLLKQQYQSVTDFKNQKEEVEKELESLRKQNMTLKERLALVEMEREQHKVVNMALHKEMAILQSINKELEEKLQQLEEVNMEFKSTLGDLMNTIQLELEQTHINQQIVDNTVDLVSQLPSNSPIRRPLLGFFTQELSQDQAKRIYGISDRTYRRVMKGNGSILTEQKYTPNVTRKRVTEDQLKEAKEILDDILPVQSGRDFRPQEMTNKRLYELYESSVEGKPVSKSYFFYQILAKEKIHHSKNTKFCSLCEKYEDEKDDEEATEHVQLFPIQRRSYLKDKEDISSGKDSTTVLVVQDFTQLELDGSFVQDLILCKYSYNKESPDHLNREYKHFIGQVGDKNDISFVAGAWLSLIKSNWFNGVKTVKIWSDGGPKHFKISANMKFLLAIQQEEPNIKWIYNFFASYHGCSICDGVAAQAKETLSRTMRNTQKAIRTVPEAIEIVGKLCNHVASTVAITSNNLSTPTLHGIKSFHKFEADKHKNYIFAYRTSEDSKWAKRYQPQNIDNLSDLFQ